jgi:protein AroM
MNARVYARTHADTREHTQHTRARYTRASVATYKRKIMMNERPLLGTITIGQAPRADITPILQAALPPSVPARHIGVLDGLSSHDIATHYAPRPGQPMLVTRLLDGNSVILDKAAVQTTLSAKVAELEAAGCTVILVLCTGEFHGLAARHAWLVEPDRIVPPAAAALAGDRQVGIIVPLAEQATTDAGKFSMLSRTPLCEAASPYDQGLQAVENAARTLRDRSAEMILMDCMGFVEEHRTAVRHASNLPTVLSNALIAKLVAELVA